MNPTYHVNAEWDDEASVWVASSDDVPGLATGADTVEELIEKLKIIIPELLEENGLLPAGVTEGTLLAESRENRARPRGLMADNFTPRVKSLLRSSGCVFVRHGKGDHEIWSSPKNGRRFMVDNNIKSRHWANHTLKQAGLPKAF